MKKISERKRASISGRGGGHPFLRLPHFVINSAEWAQLSGNEVRMLIDIACQYNGRNNGDLSFPRSRYQSRGWSGVGVAHGALTSLKEKGWLILTRQGGRQGCSLYAVTFFAMDESNKHPCHREHKPSHLWKNAHQRITDVSKNAVVVPNSGHHLYRNPDSKTFSVRDSDKKIVQRRA